MSNKYASENKVKSLIFLIFIEFIQVTAFS